jgi:hypothetical protein
MGLNLLIPSIAKRNVRIILLHIVCNLGLTDYLMVLVELNGMRELIDD